MLQSEFFQKLISCAARLLERLEYSRMGYSLRFYLSNNSLTLITFSCTEAKTAWMEKMQFS